MNDVATLTADDEIISRSAIELIGAVNLAVIRRRDNLRQRRVSRVRRIGRHTVYNIVAGTAVERVATILAIDEFVVVGAGDGVCRAPTLERDDPVRVLLEPGALRTLLVRDADGAPIAGARVLDAGRLLGSTDGEGRCVVDLVEALEGPLSIAYEALEAHWNPGDGAADVGPAVVVLEAGD